MRRTQPGSAAVLAVTAGTLVALLSGCGSTVALRGSSAAAGGNGLGGPATTGSAAAAGTGGTGTTSTGTLSGAGSPGSAGGPVAAAGGSGSVAAAGSVTTGGAGAGGGTGAAAGAPVPGTQLQNGIPEGPGVSATTITIGYEYTTNGNAANAAIGAANISSGDPLGEANAVVADINAHGGVAGRRMKIVPKGDDATSAQSTAQQDAATCATFTQDTRVFAAAAAGLTDNVAACLNKAGVLQAYSGDLIFRDDAFFRQYPHYTDLGTLSQDRMMRDLARQLVAQNYFSGWDTALGAASATAPAKVGVLGVDLPEWTRPENAVLLPALARSGHAPAAPDVINVPSPGTTSQVGSTVAAVQNAAVRFRADGVTHLILLDPSGTLTLFFTENAKQQRYYPRFGVNSGTGMQALVTAGDIDPTQFKGAVGIGWLPEIDLSPAAAAHYNGPGTAHCLAVMKAAGFSFPDANSRDIATGICDQFYFLATVINRAGPSVTLAHVQAAEDALGSGFAIAGLPAAEVSATQHSAVSTVFDLVWDSTCSCARYTDQGHAAP